MKDRNDAERIGHRRPGRRKCCPVRQDVRRALGRKFLDTVGIENIHPDAPVRRAPVLCRAYDAAGKFLVIGHGAGRGTVGIQRGPARVVRPNDHICVAAFESLFVYLAGPQTHPVGRPDASGVGRELRSRFSVRLIRRKTGNAQLVADRVADSGTQIQRKLAKQ